MIFPPLIIMLCVTFTALVQRLLAMVKAISAAASTTIPAGETTWGAVLHRAGAAFPRYGKGDLCCRLNGYSGR